MKLDKKQSFDLASIVTAGLLVIGYPGPSVAIELDCGELANRLTMGDDYQIHLELQTQNVRIEFGDDYCEEPAAAWFGRNIILPVPARRDMTLPAAALEAPRSAIGSPPAAERGTEAAPLPGQQMRVGHLPDLGFDSVGQESVPLPIQRASDIPTTSSASQQQGTEQPEDPGTNSLPEEPGSTASGVRISGDPKGGAARVTKYEADSPGAASLQQAEGIPESSGNGASSTAAPGSDPGSSPGSGSGSKSEPESKPPHVCDREVTDFWKAGEHMIDGQMTSLTGVFTVDLDNDGRVDNVGFKIGAKGRIGNVLGYFPVSKGRLSAQSVPTLKLENDEDLHRLCAGDVTFKAMTSTEKLKAVGSAKRRQQELSPGAKPASDAPNVEPEEPGVDESEETINDLTAEEKTENLLFWAVIIATVFFLLGGVGLFFAVRNMRSRDDEEDEDDDEDEDGNERR